MDPPLFTCHLHIQEHAEVPARESVAEEDIRAKKKEKATE